MKRNDPLSTATLNAFDFECRLQGIDPNTERARLMRQTNGRESDRQLVAGWWILPSFVIALALIVAGAAWVALRLPMSIVSALFGGVMIVGMAALVVIAFLLGPRY